MAVFVFPMTLGWTWAVESDHYRTDFWGVTQERRHCQVVAHRRHSLITVTCLHKLDSLKPHFSTSSSSTDHKARSSSQGPSSSSTGDKAQRTWLHSPFVLAQGENREALRQVLTRKLEEMIFFHLHASHLYDPFPHMCRSELLVIWGPPAPRGHPLHFFSHVPLQLLTSGNALSSSPSSTFSACLPLLPPAGENFLLL